MAEGESDKNLRRRVQSIEVGFRVLRVLRMAEGPLPLREIAARAGMPPSKVHLYLVSFVREDMAYQDAKTGYYGLGTFAIQLGLAAIRQLDVVSVAADAMSELRDKTQCAVYLSLWGDRGPCIVAKADGALQGSFAVRLGYILPITGSATGLIFMANLPKAEIDRARQAEEAYQKFLGNNVKPNEKEIARQVENVRKNRYASSTGLVNPNFAAVAAPIYDYAGKLAATITVLGPLEFVRSQKEEELVKLMLAAADSVSQRMGA